MKTKLPPEEKQKTTELNGIPAELESTKQLAESVDQLQQEILRLKEQLQTLNRRSATRTGIVFAIPGILSIVFSIISQSQVLAFIGLGLTFWGALFYLVRPIAYVRGSFLSTTATTYYQTIDRIIRDLGCKGKPISALPERGLPTTTPQRTQRSNRLHTIGRKTRRALDRRNGHEQIHNQKSERSHHYPPGLQLSRPI
jgi:hypothetical protein